MVDNSKDRLTLELPTLARLLGISRGQIYELAARGQLPVPLIRCGRRMFVACRDVEELLGSTGKGKEG